MKWLLMALCLSPVVFVWASWPALAVFTSGVLFGLLKRT